MVASLAGWAGGVRGLAGGGCGDTERTADDERDVDNGGGDADVFGDGPALAMERAIQVISSVDYCARVCADFMPFLFAPVNSKGKTFPTNRDSLS